MQNLNITAGISDVVYHYTSINKAYQILEENEFKLTFVSSSDDANTPKNKYYYLATTRSKLGAYHIGSNWGVLLKLNGRKLGNNLIGNPIDYWGREFRKVAPAKNEMEDRIWSDEPSIENAAKYIDEVHIFFVGDLHNNDATKRQLRELLLVAKKKGIPTYLYIDENSARMLDKRKAIPLSKIDLKTGPKEKAYNFGKRDDMAPWLELYEKDDEKYLSTEPFGGAKRSLRNLNSFDNIETFKSDIHNSKRGTPALHKIVEILKKEDWNINDFYRHLKEKWLQKSSK